MPQFKSIKVMDIKKVDALEVRIGDVITEIGVVIDIRREGPASKQVVYFYNSIGSSTFAQPGQDVFILCHVDEDVVAIITESIAEERKKEQRAQAARNRRRRSALR